MGEDSQCCTCKREEEEDEGPSVGGGGGGEKGDRVVAVGPLFTTDKK